MRSTFQEATTDPVWQQMAPLLDEAMMRLGRQEREAIVLRFFRDQNLREAAAGLNVSEAAAQKRVHRALEKLRKFFAKRGVNSTTAIIAGAGVAWLFGLDVPTALAWSVIAGGFGQVYMQYPAMKRFGFRVRGPFTLKDEGVIKMARLMLPTWWFRAARMAP